MVLFRADGSFDPEATNTAIGHALVSVAHAVIPGFYGAMPDGSVKTDVGVLLKVKQISCYGNDS